jgi:hypothetical protein
MKRIQWIIFSTSIGLGGWAAALQMSLSPAARVAVLLVRLLLVTGSRGGKQSS